MIVDIDHVAFSSYDIDTQVASLKGLGYTLNFIRRNIPNLEIKRKMLKSFNNIHHTAMLKKNKSFSVELIDEGNINLHVGCFRPVLEGVELRNAVNNKIEVGGKIFTNRYFESFGTEVYTLDHITGQNNFLFNKLMMESWDIFKSAEFWKKLGFTEIARCAGFCILKFRSVLENHNYFLYIIKKQKPDIEFRLDDKGFTCLAFVSTSIKRDIKNIQDLASYISATEIIEIGQHGLEIGFICGPCGELVELAAVQRREAL